MDLGTLFSLSGLLLKNANRSPSFILAHRSHIWLIRYFYISFLIFWSWRNVKRKSLYIDRPLWSSSDFTINRRIIFSTGVEWYDVVFHIFCGYFSICFAEVAIALSLQITLTLEKNFQKEFLKQILIKNIATFAGKTCDLTNCPDMRKKFCPYLEPRAW